MGIATETQAEFAAAIAEARKQTDEIFSCLVPAAMYDRPVDERHRLIFYLGHLEAFDWNQIGRAGLGLPASNPAFDKLFEFGIDPEIGGGPADQPSNWPTVREVLHYNERVRETIDRYIHDAPPELAHIAIEHRLMHAETLAYLIHRLPFESKSGPAPALAPPRIAPLSPIVAIPAGDATLGIDPAEPFGWDNEFARHSVPVPEFRIGKFKITNGDYLAFVEAGGPVPPFWIPGETDGWKLRTMFADIPLPLDWPVFVTHHQATAFAQSRGMRLPTEPEFHRAAFGGPHGVEHRFPWGEASPTPAHANAGFHQWDPLAVDANPLGDSAFGIAQTVGNGWEWTSTVFAPFSGFRPSPTYPGYSANFFDGRHYVLKGGSPRTAARLLRRSFRNWFRPDYPHVYAAFRLAESSE